jgi:hypothetical protein
MSTPSPHETPAAPPATIVQTDCCPPFDPQPWEGQRLTWNDKLFVADHVHCLFHMPLDMRSRVIKNERLIAKAKAAPSTRPLMLSDMGSAWGTEFYFEVTHPVPDARMASISGTFLTKVYEGPYRDTRKWVADVRRHVAAQHEQLDKLYFGYTVCPRCAKAYGKNYVILLAKIRGEAQPARAA